MFLKNEIKKDTKGIGDLLKNLESKKKIIEKAWNMIKIAYKIRCRLFHDEKNPLLDVNEKVSNAADQVFEEEKCENCIAKNPKISYGDCLGCIKLSNHIKLRIPNIPGLIFTLSGMLEFLKIKLKL